MTERARILFVAGDSGTGKTSACLAFQIYGPLLCTDIICERAGMQYFGSQRQGFAKWSVWAPELEKPESRARLEKAFCDASFSAVDEKLTNALDLTIEGEITGYPQFRDMTLRILEREFQIAVTGAEIHVFCLAPPSSTILEYIRKRGRPADAHLTLQDVEQRAARYALLMNGQNVRTFESAPDLRKAGIALFRKGQRILTMTTDNFRIRQLADELQPPASGKQSIVLADDDKTKVVLFGFATGDGLTEHIAAMPAIIQILRGEASLTVGDEIVAGKPGTWIQMAARTRHSIRSQTPVIMLLTLLK